MQSMARADFSESFRNFIAANVTSVEQIEVLLILLANPDRAWTIAEMSAILRSTPNSISHRLDALEKRKLAAGSPQAGYRYIATGRLHEMVEMLKNEFTIRRYSVIELVFSPADTARSFADAFRFRRDQDDDDG